MRKDVTCKICKTTVQVHGYQHTLWLVGHIRTKHPEIYAQAASSVALVKENLARIRQLTGIEAYQFYKLYKLKIRKESSSENQVVSNHS